MASDYPEEPGPKRPRDIPSISVWPGGAYFVIAVLIFMIVAQLMRVGGYR
jgi:hypothetical protein